MEKRCLCCIFLHRSSCFAKRCNCDVTLNMKMLTSDGTSPPTALTGLLSYLLLSCLISSDPTFLSFLTSFSLLVPLSCPLAPSWMSLLRSAVWHLQSDTFTPPVTSGLLSAISKQQHTHRDWDAPLLRIRPVDLPEQSWTIWTRPASMMKLKQMSHAAEPALFGCDIWF